MRMCLSRPVELLICNLFEHSFDDGYHGLCLTILQHLMAAGVKPAQLLVDRAGPLIDQRG